MYLVPCKQIKLPAPLSFFDISLISFFCQSLVLEVGSASFCLVTNLSNLFTSSFSSVEHCSPILFRTNLNVDILKRVVTRTQRSHNDVSLFFFTWIRMLMFFEDLESSPSFWTAALQTKCQKLAEPTICRKMTDWKIKEKKEER